MENFSQALGSDTAMGTHHIVWDAQSGCTVNKDTVAVSWFARGHQGPFVFTSSLLWLPVCGHITSRSSWTFGCKFAPVWCSWLLSFFLPCPALVPGLALMSSTASISKCCLWWPSRSPPSRKHSSRGYVRNLWIQKQAKKKNLHLSYFGQVLVSAYTFKLHFSGATQTDILEERFEQCHNYGISYQSITVNILRGIFNFTLVYAARVAPTLTGWSTSQLDL